MAERIDTTCDECGGIDKHPQHVSLNSDGTTRARHHDCCAATGCGVCTEILADAGKNAHGDALVAHLTKGL